MKKLFAIILFFAAFAPTAFAMQSPIFGAVGCFNNSGITTRRVGLEVGTNCTLNGTDDTVKQVIPTTGTITNLHFSVGVAPGSGKSWNAALVVDGSTTALTCTIQDLNTACTPDTTHVITLTAGHYASWIFTPTGTPAQAIMDVSAVFTDAAGNSTPILSGRTTTPAANVTTFWNISPGNTNATETSVWLPVPTNGIITNLYADCGTAPGGSDTNTITLRVAKQSTALACTMTGATTQCNSAGSIAVAAQDYVDLQFVSSATAASCTRFRTGMTFVPTINGERPIFNGSTSWATTPQYPGYDGVGTVFTVSASSTMLAPTAFQAKKLLIVTASNIASGKTITLTHQNNGVAGLLAATIVGVTGPTPTSTDMTNIDNVVENDMWNFVVSSVGAPSVSGNTSWVAFINPAVFIAPARHIFHR